MVVATDKKGVIGREDRIPWRLRTDLIKLNRLTKGHTIILGRKTYESMDWYYNQSGREMPGAMYIVVSRNSDFVASRQNVTVVHSIDEAMAKAKEIGDDDVLVIGGGGIFAAMLPHTGRIYLTEVQADVDGDAYFPKLNMSEWRETSREHHQQDEKNDHDFDMIVLERV